MKNFSSLLRVCKVALCILPLFLVTSCGKTGSNLQIPGVTGPTLNILEDKIVISTVFEEANFNFGGVFPIPKYPNSTVEFGPDAFSDGMVMTISMSLQDVFSDSVKKLDPKTLPGGRPLPGIAGGSLPAVAFTIEEFRNISFYVGTKALGVFVPIPTLPMKGGMLSARFYVAGQRAGNLSLVGQDAAGINGGFLLLIDLSTQMKKQLLKVKSQYE